MALTSTSVCSNLIASDAVPTHRSGRGSGGVLHQHERDRAAMEPDLIGQEKGSRETERLARRDAAARERLGGEAVLDL